MKPRVPVVEGLFREADDGSARLLGGRCPVCGASFFPKQWSFCRNPPCRGAALDDVDHVRTSVTRNADDRQEFFNQANARMLRAIDSQTNFVMLNTEWPSLEIVEHFKRHNVLVAGSIPSFDRYIRVTIGVPSAMREFWRVWDLNPHKMTM